MWQVGADSGNDVNWDTSIKDQMSVFGAGLGYWLIPSKLYVNAKYSTTYGLKQHFKTNIFQVQLMLIPNIFKKQIMI